MHISAGRISRRVMILRDLHRAQRATPVTLPASAIDASRRIFFLPWIEEEGKKLVSTLEGLKGRSNAVSR